LCLVSGGWYGASLAPYLERFGDQLLVVLYDDLQDDPKWTYRAVLEHIGASTDFVPPDLDEVVFSNQQNRRGGISDEDRRTLWPYFEDDIKKLEPMIARDLSAWDPTPGSARWPEPPGNLLELQRRTMEWVEGVIANIRPDQLDAATPCPEMTVRGLLVHMVTLVLINAQSFDTEDAEGTTAILARAESDPASAYRAANDLLREASERTAPWRKQALVVPAGLLPTAIQLAGNLVNQVGHGWDLAVATGQGATIPSDIVEPIDTFARALYQKAPLLRETLGDEVAVDASAGSTDRFAAFLGRDPSVAARMQPS
jgi:uncharacterized protein (TIGR03086 family)